MESLIGLPLDDEIELLTRREQKLVRDVAKKSMVALP